MLNLHPKNESRFSRKLESFLWWSFKLLPLLIFLIMNIGYWTAKPMWQFFMDDGDFSDFFMPGISLHYVFEHFGFLMANPISSVLQDIFLNTLPFLHGFGFDVYVSYLVFIEILHLFFDVVVFIPKLARKWINMACQED